MRKYFLLLCTLPLLTRLEAQTVTVTGEVTTPLTLSAADLASMPRTNAVAKDKQGAPHTFTGVALTEILGRAGVTLGPQLRGKNLAKYVLVTCDDGYQVVFSLGELDTTFGDRGVILADQEEGKPLSPETGPFRIVAPGDKKPARNCFKVRTITIRKAAE
jgi:DMSO/TMAO reductase YedYZ molybdopterin-dependent catalytic subunit